MYLGLGLPIVGGPMSDGGVAIISSGTSALQSNITFTRASSGTYSNSAGVQTTAGVNEPRFDYDPVTLAPRGFLRESSSTNLALQSGNFANAAWNKIDTVGTANAIVSPDGGTNASLLTEGSLGTAEINQVTTISSGATFTDSVFLKRGNNDWMRIEADDAVGNGARTYVNLATGVLGTTSNVGTGTGATATIQDVGNGWYRISLTTTVAASIIGKIRIISAASNGGSRVNNATYYAWGGQIEQLTFATSYIPTSGAAATRATDVATISDLTTIGFNQTEGTLFVEAECGGSSSTGNVSVASINNATTANRIQIRRDDTSGTADQWVCANVVGSTTSLNVAGGTNSWPVGSIMKLANAYKSNNSAACVNGAATTNTIAATFSASPTRLQIGTGMGDAAGGAVWWIRKISYYPIRFPNPTLQAITS